MVLVIHSCKQMPVSGDDGSYEKEREVRERARERERKTEKKNEKNNDRCNERTSSHKDAANFCLAGESPQPILDRRPQQRPPLKFIKPSSSGQRRLRAAVVCRPSSMLAVRSVFVKCSHPSRLTATTCTPPTTTRPRLGRLQRPRCPRSALQSWRTLSVYRSPPSTLPSSALTQIRLLCPPALPPQPRPLHGISSTSFLLYTYPTPPMNPNSHLHRSRPPATTLTTTEAFLYPSMQTFSPNSPQLPRNMHSQALQA